MKALKKFTDNNTGFINSQTEQRLGLIYKVLQNRFNKNVANPDHLFLSKRKGRSQEGCCGNVSAKKSHEVLLKLQETAPPGISFEKNIYPGTPSILGTCTAMSLEFASAYFRLRSEFKDMSSGDKPFLEKLRQLKSTFETSSAEMRNRQYAYSSITVDRTVNMDVSRTKIEACCNYHNFKIDHCTNEIDISMTENTLEQEIDALPYGVYFIRMLKPGDNHKLEARGHSMIDVHEKDLGLFYDNNWKLEKLSPKQGLPESKLLYSRLLGVHKEWDIPMTRLYRLQELHRMQPT